MSVVVEHVATFTCDGCGKGATVNIKGSGPGDYPRLPDGWNAWRCSDRRAYTEFEQVHTCSRHCFGRFLLARAEVIMTQNDPPNSELESEDAT